jgi:hypothetical protein
MNDFTKEELEDLCYATRIMYKNCFDYPSDKNPSIIYEKLLSILNNHCEPDTTAVHQNKCPDCGKNVD